VDGGKGKNMKIVHRDTFWIWVDFAKNLYAIGFIIFFLKEIERLFSASGISREWVENEKL